MLTTAWRSQLSMTWCIHYRMHHLLGAPEILHSVCTCIRSKIFRLKQLHIHRKVPDRTLDRCMYPIPPRSAWTAACFNVFLWSHKTKKKYWMIICVAVQESDAGWLASPVIRHVESRIKCTNHINGSGIPGASLVQFVVGHAFPGLKCVGKTMLLPALKSLILS